jgi:hypothetical protein
MEDARINLSKQDYDAIVLSGVAIPKNVGTSVREEDGEQIFKIKVIGQNRKEEHSIQVVVDKEKISTLSDNPDQIVKFPVNVGGYQSIEIGLTEKFRELIKSKQ